MATSDETSKGSGLPATYAWRPMGIDDGIEVLARDDREDGVAGANIRGRWWTVPRGSRARPSGTAIQRPGESLLVAAQREAVAALWRRDGFGVGEVRGLPVPLTVADAIALTAETALPADVAHCERPTPLPGLAGLWRLHALRVVGDGVEVDARRVDAVARYEREHDPQGTCSIRGCSRDASGAHDSNGDLCGEHRTAENALGREPIATPESHGPNPAESPSWYSPAPDASPDSNDPVAPETLPGVIALLEAWWRQARADGREQYALALTHALTNLREVSPAPATWDAAAQPVLTWTKSESFPDLRDEWEAYAGPYRLHVDRHGPDDYWDQGNGGIPYRSLVEAQLGAETALRARLPDSMRGDRNAFAALNAATGDAPFLAALRAWEKATRGANDVIVYDLPATLALLDATRSTLATPADPVGEVVAEVMAKLPSVTNDGEPWSANTHYWEGVVPVVESIPEDEAPTRENLISIAAAALAGILACDAKGAPDAR